VHLDCGGGDGRKAADARPDDDARTLEILGRLGFPAGIGDRLVRRGDGVQDEVVNAAPRPSTRGTSQATWQA
jgi:hypothetical protein